MKARRIAAETLIQMAIETLEGEVRPTLGSAHGADADDANSKYAMAMALSALRIARREILIDEAQPLWELLDTIYPDGDGTALQLAADIRLGEVNESAPPDLVAQLKQTVISELRVRNPAFLKSRGIEG